MLRRLPYRVQIPLGLSLAVVIAALLVTGIAAQISARTARQDILATLDRAVVLLIAQARPCLQRTIPGACLRCCAIRPP